LTVGVLLVAAAALHGCATARLESPPVTGSITPAVVVGDFDDVRAAVEVSVGRSEMAVVRVDESTPGELVFELLTIRDEPSELKARAAEGGMVELSARIGRFGDERRERRLIGDVVERLRQLHGREVAPLPEGW
jgi:hypothetical protein